MTFSFYGEGKGFLRSKNRGVEEKVDKFNYIKKCFITKDVRRKLKKKKRENIHNIYHRSFIFKELKKGPKT